MEEREGIFSIYTKHLPEKKIHVCWSFSKGETEGFSGFCSFFGSEQKMALMVVDKVYTSFHLLYVTYDTVYIYIIL